jgi:hypothetical protein
MSNDTAWTPMSANVALASTSCAARSSGARRRSPGRRRAMSSPQLIARLAVNSAASPEARLVVQTGVIPRR